LATYIEKFMSINKKKKIYGLLIILNLLALIMAGGVLYARISFHFLKLPEEIRLSPKPVLKKEPVPKPIMQRKKQGNPNSHLKDKILVTRPKEEKSKKNKAFKTIFSYHAPDAKSVSVVGSFSRWKPIKMERKNGNWTVYVWILPGKYIYHYRVDGEKMLDPRKPKAEIGESIVEVK